jgi:hypothetical protein
LSRHVLRGNVRIERVRHEQRLLADGGHAGFGSLLYDARGHLVLHDRNKTWLYTVATVESLTDGRSDWYGKWITHVREFDVETLTCGEKRIALGLAYAEKWAIIHDVIAVDDLLYVAFYSAYDGVRAAISTKPDGPFNAQADFKIALSQEWERQGGPPESLESNGAHVLIDESDRDLTLWVGYDSYHVDLEAGQLGWAKVRIDKRARRVELLGKHPDNPLPLLPHSSIAARSGGNLGTAGVFGDVHAFLYYTRPTRESLVMTMAFSRDPLFQDVIETLVFEPPLGEETWVEKYESYWLGGKLHVIYENQLTSGHWGTGMRIYQVSRGLKSW